MLTSTMKQYIKHIYLLGACMEGVPPLYVAKALGVNSSAVTRMVKKLANLGLLEYEYYGRLNLTEEGKQLGQTLVKEQDVLLNFLRMIGIKEDQLRKELEAIQYNLPPALINRLTKLNEFFCQHPSLVQSFSQFSDP
ncbi:metal-dependent transcriptional regulator [Neobacillus niacini]|uniref:metal-dependent transcriptional regulator n=1 Tax=Neobacillus niacini TaxID=86668 RepID=UPI0021CB225E|nr:iron dependent repressor, metal binding and dimerization domain protein [Neobacillus niacini]MCM3767257.1 hypothetical protein [Neobacillus niacini]